MLTDFHVRVFLLLATTTLVVTTFWRSYDHQKGGRLIQLPPLRSNRVHDDITSLSAHVEDQPVLNGADVIALMRRNGLDPVLVSERYDALPPVTKKSADRISSSDFTVPNVVHYACLSPNNNNNNSYKLKFLHYVGFAGVQRFIRPDAIFVHGDLMPNDTWWKRIVTDVKNVYFVKINKPTHARSGETFNYIEHAADVLRVTTLIEYGGIYLDTDVIVVRSFDSLRRNYSVVYGRESGAALNSGIIVSRRGAPFMRMVLEAYRSYKGSKRDSWAYLACHLPQELANMYPHLVHIEETSIARPNWTPSELRQLYFENTYNWTSNYCIHVWSHMNNENNVLPTPSNHDELAASNSTLGQVMRHALYGEDGEY